MSFSVVVLGCGWAGILVSYILAKKFPHVNIACIDKEAELGGLLRTEIIDGFVFDIGGSHVIFSKDQGILRRMLLFLNNNIVEHRRKTYVYLDGIYIPYPFENGIWVLPPKIRAEVLTSFIETLFDRIRNPCWRPRNLREWIYGFFGREIARLYLEPYNEKIWKRPLDVIDVDWVYMPGRLPIPDWRDVVRSGVGVATEGYKEQARFYYPSKGGIQTLYDAVLKRALRKGLKVIKGVKVERIRKVKNIWKINSTIKTKKIISTIPLSELMKALDAPEHILRLAEQLDYNKVAIVGLALRKSAPRMHWVYVPDKSIIFHRYAWISNYSPYNVPSEEFSAIIAEITIPPWEDITQEKLIRETIEGMKKLGVLSESEKELLFIKVWVNPYGYPIHTLSTTRARKKILKYLREQEIYVSGRWGTWRYLNMDKIYKEVLKLYRNFSVH